MKLRALRRYSSDPGGEWPAGREDDVSEELGQYLLRDSPGTFEVVGLPGPATPEAQAAVGAMSTETATGLVPGDRRQRGGKIR